MTLAHRRIILYSFILIFILIIPPIIAYSFGYNFDWQTKSFIKTGIFNVKSYPSNANILIDNKLYKKTPNFIKGLKPKVYNLKVTKAGYSTWSKDLQINPAKITESVNILLLAQEPIIKVVKQNLTPSFKIEDYFYTTSTINYLVNDSNQILYQVNPQNNQQSQISVQPLLETGDYKIITSKNKSSIAVLSESHTLYLFDTESKSFNKITNNALNAEFSTDNRKILYYTKNELWVMWLTKTEIQPYKESGDYELITRFGEPITKAVWSTVDNEHIFFVIGNTIKMVELDGRSNRNINDFLKISGNNAQLYFNNGSLYFTENNILKSTIIKNLFLQQILN